MRVTFEILFVLSKVDTVVLFQKSMLGKPVHESKVISRPCNFPIRRPDRHGPTMRDRYVFNDKRSQIAEALSLAILRADAGTHDWGEAGRPTSLRAML